jgi:hypothetical protein
MIKVFIATILLLSVTGLGAWLSKREADRFEEWVKNLSQKGW